MRKIQLLNYAFFALLFGYLVNEFSLAMGEEHLNKNKFKYLGWRTGKDEFKLCDEEVMKIGDGTIKKTSEKCLKDGGLKPMVKLFGSVTMIDQPNLVFQIKDLKGNTYKFFFPEGKKQLGDLKIEERVMVTVPISGRALAIELLDKDKIVPKDFIDRKTKKE